MGKADDEIQQIITRLSQKFLQLSMTGRVVPQKPSGQEYVQLQHDMHRLLILKGMIREGEVVPIDMWEMFLNEFGPKTRVVPPRRPASPYPCARILPRPPIPPVAASEAMNAANGRCQQQQQQEQGSSASASAPASSSGRRVRFQFPLPQPRR